MEDDEEFLFLFLNLGAVFNNSSPENDSPTFDIESKLV